MNDPMLKYQCPACGAPLEFSPEKQMLLCASCDSEFPQGLFNQPDAEAQMQAQAAETGTNIDWNLAGYVDNQQNMGEQAGFICTSCGAEVVSDGNTVATECMYCGNPVVMSGNVSGMVKPDYVLPFKINRDQAQNMLRDFYKGKPLLPSSFTAGNRLQKISGLYVPFWLFTCSGSGHMNFTATKVRRWSDSNYNYTQTKTYDVFRAGNVAFDNIPVDASTKMDDKYMDGVEPFNYQEIAEFSPMYMAGYFADKFDVGVEECSERASNRVEGSLEDSLKNTVSGYTTVNKNSSFINMHGEDIKYALLPIWMLNTKFNGELYQFAINGQTGRVSGRLPIDKGKLWLYRLGITIASAIPLYLIAQAVL